MKRVYGILVLIVLMIFGGCIGKKDERVTGGNGVTQVEKPYVYTQGTIGLIPVEIENFRFLTLVDKKYKYNYISNYKIDDKEFEKLEIEIENLKGKVYILRTIAEGLEIENYLKKEVLKVENLVIKSFGTIEFNNLLTRGRYVYGEVSNVSKKADGLLAKVENTEIKGTILIGYESEIDAVEIKKVTEAIIQSFEIVVGNTGGVDTTEEQKRREKEIAMLRELEEIGVSIDSLDLLEIKLNELYAYIENNYIDTGGKTREEIDREVMDYIANKWIYNENRVVRKVLNKFDEVYIDALEGELAIVTKTLNDLEIKDKRASNYIELEKALERVIEQRIARERLEGRPDDEEVAIWNMRYKYGETSGYVTRAIEALVIHYAEVVRIEYLKDNDEKSNGFQGDIVENQFENVIRFQKMLELDVSIVDEIRSGNAKAAREFLRKEAINTLLNSNKSIGTQVIPAGETKRDLSFVAKESKEKIKNYKKNKLKYANNDFYVTKGNTNLTDVNINDPDLNDKKDLIVAKLQDLSNFIKYFEKDIVLSLNTISDLDNVKDKILVAGTTALLDYRGDTTEPNNISTIETSNLGIFISDIIIKKIDSSYILD